MRVKEELSKLKEMDVYSLILFALFKLRDIPEYSALSELAYILDKDSLLKLCEYFGGITITIPTIDELECLVYSLVLYQYVDIDGMEYDKAVKLIGHRSSDLRKVKSEYSKLKEILQQYSLRNSDV